MDQEKKIADMFDMNSHMNRRINELEEHKKKLLDLLKKHNISPEATLFLIE